MFQDASISATRWINQHWLEIENWAEHNDDVPNGIRAVYESIRAIGTQWRIDSQKRLFINSYPQNVDAFVMCNFAGNSFLTGASAKEFHPHYCRSKFCSRCAYHRMTESRESLCEFKPNLYFFTVSQTPIPCKSGSDFYHKEFNRHLKKLKSLRRHRHIGYFKAVAEMYIHSISPRFMVNPHSHIILETNDPEGVASQLQFNKNYSIHYRKIKDDADLQGTHAYMFKPVNLTLPYKNAANNNGHNNARLHRFIEMMDMPRADIRNSKLAYTIKAKTGKLEDVVPKRKIRLYKRADSQTAVTAGPNKQKPESHVLRNALLGAAGVLGAGYLGDKYLNGGKDFTAIKSLVDPPAPPPAPYAGFKYRPDDIIQHYIANSGLAYKGPDLAQEGVTGAYMGVPFGAAVKNLIKNRGTGASEGLFNDLKNTVKPAINFESPWAGATGAKALIKGTGMAGMTGAGGAYFTNTAIKNNAPDFYKAHPDLAWGIDAAGAAATAANPALLGTGITDASLHSFVGDNPTGLQNAEIRTLDALSLTPPGKVIIPAASWGLDKTRQGADDVINRVANPVDYGNALKIMGGEMASMDDAYNANPTPDKLQQMQNFAAEHMQSDKTLQEGEGGEPMQYWWDRVKDAIFKKPLGLSNLPKGNKTFGNDLPALLERESDLFNKNTMSPQDAAAVKAKIADFLQKIHNNGFRFSNYTGS